jgi:hypothetical protein
MFGGRWAGAKITMKEFTFLSNQFHENGRGAMGWHTIAKVNPLPILVLASGTQFPGAAFLARLL